VLPTALPELDRLRATFDSTTPLTVGLEEEVLLVDPDTWAPVPHAADVAATAADQRVVTELPVCQVELRTRPHPTAAGAVTELATAREVLRRASGPGCRPVAAAVHPAVSRSEVSTSDRARALRAEYGDVAERQLVGALQVHVAVGDADATLAVYNALRGHLPDLAALAAAAPFHDGRDTGLASVRPLVSTQLPRQGVPPVIESWPHFLEDLDWGARAGRLPEPLLWWWELRPHLVHGTLEVRVPDVQPTIADARGVATFVRALVGHLLAAHQDGRDLDAPASWRIGENRWSALRHGVHGRMADLDTGETEATADRLHRLLDTVEPHAPDGLDEARALLDAPAADRLRDAGLDGAVPWLAEVFTTGAGG